MERWWEPAARTYNPRCACFCVQDWQYSAEKLRVELSNIPAENKDIPSMVTAVKEVCLKHGVKLASCGTRREQVPGGGGRLLMCTLKCIHGMPNRQAEHKGNATGEPHRLDELEEDKCPPSGRCEGCQEVAMLPEAARFRLLLRLRIG